MTAKRAPYYHDRGFPLSAWAFAFRTWAAMMVALYAAFWLQLDNAWSAAVTVSILSMQTRGQTYQRAVYWVLAAIIGVVASLAIGGMFPQSRELFVIGLAVTLGLCVYAANLLDTTGRTPLFCAVIRLPRSLCRRSTRRRTFSRLGSTAARRSWWELRRSPWSDVFAAPNIHTGLSGKLAATHRRVRAYALAILRGETADPIHSANLLREITALHPDITALAAESSDGGARGAAARSAAVALVAEVRAAGALSSLPGESSPSLRSELGWALDDVPGGESRALQLRLQRQADVGCADPNDALFARHGLDLLIENRRAQDAIAGPEGGSQSCTPYPGADLPIATGRRAKRPAWVSGGADLRDPVVPRRLAVRVAGPRRGWEHRSAKRHQPEPACFRRQRRYRDGDRRAPCGRDRVPDPRWGRPVSPSGNRHGAKRPLRRLVVNEAGDSWCSSSSP